MSDSTPTACPHPYGCQCAICRPVLLTTDEHPIPEELKAKAAEAVFTAMLAVVGGLRASRAEDKLRAQRKRHAQRLAELQAKLDEAVKLLDEAMEVVRYVACGEYLNAWGADAKAEHLHHTFVKAKALFGRGTQAIVARERKKGTP